MPIQKSSKVKKKLWYPIVAPKMFKERILGETLAYDPKLLIGKTLNYSLMGLANEVRKQNVNIRFRIDNVEGNKATTQVIGYELNPSQVKRIVRKSNSKIDASFAATTSDNMKLRIKVLLLTKSETKNSIAAKIRKMSEEQIKKKLQKQSFEELVQDLITHKLQDSIKEHLKKVYPVKISEVRYAGITS